MTGEVRIEFNEHGEWLLPRRFGAGDPEIDRLWSAAERLVHEGHAEWISPTSTKYPGIREIRRRLKRLSNRYGDKAMTEAEQAQKIADNWLEFDMNPLTQMVPGDPDCDACVLARQFNRALDKIQRLEIENHHLKETLNA